jgi:hypothetical protein
VQDWQSYCMSQEWKPNLVGPIENLGGIAG